MQKYEIDVIKEVVRNYAFDGIMLDRARYDCIDSTFLLSQRRCLRNSSESKLEKFPEDIFEWRPNPEAWCRWKTPEMTTYAASDMISVPEFTTLTACLTFKHLEFHGIKISTFSD